MEEALTAVIYTDARMDPQLLRSSATVADYGYDAPYALVIFAVIGAAGAFVGTPTAPGRSRKRGACSSLAGGS